MLKIKGFQYSYFWHNQTPFHEPDMLLEDMSRHHGIVGIKHHVYLLQRFQDPYLALIDPKTLQSSRRDLSEVLNEMHHFGGYFGLIKRRV